MSFQKTARGLLYPIGMESYRIKTEPIKKRIDVTLIVLHDLSARLPITNQKNVRIVKNRDIP